MSTCSRGLLQMPAQVMRMAGRQLSERTGPVPQPLMFGTREFIGMGVIPIVERADQSSEERRRDDRGPIGSDISRPCRIPLAHSAFTLGWEASVARQVRGTWRDREWPLDQPHRLPNSHRLPNGVDLGLSCFRIWREARGWMSPCCWSWPIRMMRASVPDPGFRSCPRPESCCSPMALPSPAIPSIH